MANFLANIRTSAATLEALQRSAAASENNVSNASTPGYAKQRIRLEAAGFEPGGGLAGGVQAGKLQSSRDEFIEAEVRYQESRLGKADELSAQFAYLQTAFSLNDSEGVAPSLDKLYSAFGAWTVAPASTSAKENVISAAKDVASSFNRTAEAIERAGQNAETRIQSTLNRIDDLAERIRRHNVDIRSGGAGDAGLDAAMHADLDELASLVDAQTIWQQDGTATVLVGRETALVIGDNRFRFTMTADPALPPPAFAGATPKMLITDANGVDLTRTMTGGKLGALLEFRNRTVPAYLGSAAGPGDLNRLAQTFADRVNSLLTAGDAVPKPLFTYAGSISAASSLAVDPSITAADISAADPTTTPVTGNGRALALAELAQPGSSADMLDSLSYVGFFGKISSEVGRLASEANQSIQSHKQIRAQAYTLREAASGVSLDEEAVNLVQYQRAYQATARMITVLDEISQMAVNIGRS